MFFVDDAHKFAYRLGQSQDQQSKKLDEVIALLKTPSSTVKPAAGVSAPTAPLFERNLEPEKTTELAPEKIEDPYLIFWGDIIKEFTQEEIT